MFLEVGCSGDGNSADDYDSGFVWTDGSMVDYTNWAGGEPNDWDGSSPNCGGEILANGACRAPSQSVFAPCLPLPVPRHAPAPSR